jgi:hypothetical protein
MSSTVLLPPRAQLCIRYCCNKQQQLPGLFTFVVPLMTPMSNHSSAERQGMTQWRRGRGGWQPGRAHGDAGCHRVSYFCGASHVVARGSRGTQRLPADEATCILAGCVCEQPSQEASARANCRMPQAVQATRKGVPRGPHGGTWSLLPAHVQVAGVTVQIYRSGDMARNHGSRHGSRAPKRG